MVCRPRGCGFHRKQFFFLTPPTGVPRKDVESNRGFQIFRAESYTLGLLFSPSFSQYAAQHPSIPANKLALQRMNEMYAAVTAYKSPPVGLHSLVGTLMDRHVALANSDCTTVFMAYRLGLVPEMRAGDPVTLDGTESMATNLWGKNVDHGALHRLLQKGGPFPTSVRYVGAQLERSVASPVTCDIVTNMIRLSILGAYSHSVFIAPPALRCKVYKTSGSALLALYTSLAPRTSHDYFFLVAEFVVAATRRAPMLWSWVSTHAKYAEYEVLVCTAANTIRQGGRAPRIVNAVAPRSWDPPATALSLVRATGNRKKLSREVQQLIAPVEIQRVYSGVICARQWGFVTSLLQFGGESVRALADSLTESAQRREFLALSATNQALVQVVAHALTAVMSVDTAPLTAEITELQRAAVARRTACDAHTALVCLSCATWRSKTAIPGISKGSVGVTIAMPLGVPGGISCNNCRQTWSIVAVDLVGTALKIKPRAEGCCLWVMLCTACGAPSADAKYFGTRPLCATCYTAALKPKGTCFMCLSKVQLVSFAARRDGRAVCVNACSAHLPKIAGVAGVDVSVLPLLVPKRTKMYIR